MFRKIKINFIEFVPEFTNLLGYDMTLKQCVCACVDEKPRDAFVRVKKGELRVQKMEHLIGSWGANWPVQKRRV